MERVIVLCIVFMIFCSSPSLVRASSSAGASPQLILRTDTLSRLDTIVTKKVVKRVEIINVVEEVLSVDTVGSAGDSPVVFSPPEDVRQQDAVMRKPVVGEIPLSQECSLPVQIPDGRPATEPGGKYIWIPDSISSAVDRLIQGQAVAGVDDGGIDSNEKVTFRGDTVPMVLRDRNLGRYNRGLFNYLFIPKGIWQIGMTASYGEFSTDDLELFDLMSDIDFHGKMFSIKPYFSYFIGNNMSVGMRLGYSYGRADVDSFKVDIDEDMNFDLHDIMYRSESYTAAFTFNQYFGIARRGRFGIFNEVELAFSGGNSDFIRPYNNELRHTHTTTMQASLNFSPGVSVFILEKVSFNISFGVFGFSLKNEKQTVDGEKMGSRFTSGANFRFNIFNINFGVAVNL